MKKRALSLFLAVLTVLTLCAPALAVGPTDGPENTKLVIVDPGPCGPNLTWKPENIYTVHIIGSGRMYDYGLGESPWRSYKVYDIIIDSGITSIGSYAFYDLDILTALLPASLTYIGEGAFYGCKSLPEIIIPNNVTFIGKRAFCNCTGLSSVTLPSRLSTIENWTFDGCRNLTDITIPDGVTSIGSSAFEDCSSLTVVDIPASVMEIGFSVFQGCSRLTALKIRNRDCDLPTASSLSICPKSTVIYGYPNSTAERYANTHGNQFKVLDDLRNGLVREGGQTYFYINDEKAVNQLVTAGDGKMYYCAADGHIMKGGVQKVNGKSYYLSPADGHVLTNTWISVSGANKYYAGADGVLYTGYKTIGTKSYYFSVKDCHLMKGGLVTGPGNKQYYVSAKDGHAMKGGWAQGPNHWWYYLDKTGVVIEKVRQNTRPAYTPKG